MIPEFARVVLEANPKWWVMENSPHAYAPFNDAFSIEVDNEQFGEAQSRRRRFWSNLPLARFIDLPALVTAHAGTERTVTRGTVDWKGSRAREPRRTVADMLRLQGFPEDMLDQCPFTKDGKKLMIGNGVPYPMGLAIAKAVREAVQDTATSS